MSIQLTFQDEIDISRPLAGSRRATRAIIRSSQVPLLQSITAVPALAGSSFEELRLECYRQALIATGRTPRHALTPDTAIPPHFAALPVHGLDEHVLTDVEC